MSFKDIIRQTTEITFNHSETICRVRHFSVAEGVVSEFFTVIRWFQFRQQEVLWAEQVNTSLFRNTLPDTVYCFSFFMVQFSVQK